MADRFASSHAATNIDYYTGLLKDCQIKNVKHSVIMWCYAFYGSFHCFLESCKYIVLVDGFYVEKAEEIKKEQRKAKVTVMRK